MRRTVLLYGLLAGLLVAVLRVVEYRYLVVDHALKPGTHIGPVVDQGQLDQDLEYIRLGREEGAMLSAGGELLNRGTPGFYLSPALFTDVDPKMRIAREEIFGPVLSVLTFRSAEEAIEKANDTMYGLSAGVWTSKGSKAFHLLQRLRAGVVWANTFNKFDPASPFGGFRESGFGREGGRQGLAAYVEVVG